MFDFQQYVTGLNVAIFFILLHNSLTVNREYKVSVFWYQVYHARLWECLLNREACQAIQYAFSKPSLINLISKDMNLVVYLSSSFTLQTSEDYVIMDFVSI